MSSLYRRCGMTMRTPAGAVDLVPLMRRIEGVPAAAAPIPDHERAAAVLTLAYLGLRVYEIHLALGMSHESTREVLDRYGASARPEPEAISWTGLAYNRRRAVGNG